MKYSLRSLMTFSIRDLFWFTVVVALAVGLWIERRKLAMSVERVNKLESDFMELKPGGYELVPTGVSADPTMRRFIDVERTVGPSNSSAPAPNPLKP
jgi:hypothetical protein